MNQFNSPTLDTIKKLFKPYTSRVYIVGGAVRNYLLNQPFEDIDIEVYDVDINLFEELMQTIKAKGVGKSFFVYKWNNTDISLPRTETKISSGHTGFAVSITNDEKIAARRRDFTINAIMYNIYSGKIVDFFNGKDDLVQKVIKVIDCNRFKEDNLRTLRAVRFASEYNFRIENQSLKLISSMSINDLSKTRIFDEFEKISKSLYLEIGFYYLIKSNLFTQIFNKKVSFIEFFRIYKILKKYKIYFYEPLKKYYFLYILKTFLHIDINNLELPKKYKKIDNEPFYKTISDKELCFLSIEKPIKEYLFAYQPHIITQAKRLNIYDKQLQIPVDIQNIIDQGYKGKQIKEQINISYNQFIITNLL